jgi:hypothetical protein
MFSAVVTERGADEVPVSKPLSDTTGPVKVVVAKMLPYMQVLPNRLHLVGKGVPSVARGLNVPSKHPPCGECSLDTLVKDQTPAVP